MYTISEIIATILSSAVEMRGDSNINRTIEWGEHFKEAEVEK